MLVSVITAQPQEQQEVEQQQQVKNAGTEGRTWRQIPHVAISKNQLVNFYRHRVVVLNLCSVVSGLSA